MTIIRLSESTWEQINKLNKNNLTAILPIGAIEAHGPHLPLSTDTIIAQELAERTAKKLSTKKLNILILPTIEYTCAEFASSFSGTFNITNSSLKPILLEILNNLASFSLKSLIVVNVHFDPVHLKTLHEIFDNCSRPKIIFVDFTKRKFAEIIGGEFKAGSCHAGQFETSLTLAANPKLVNKCYKTIPDKIVNLPEQIKNGKNNFNDCGMVNAYCGSPSKASAKEGAKLFTMLSNIIIDSFHNNLNTSLSAHQLRS